MRQKNILYFLDFYVPNEGEPETALEIGVLEYVVGARRPSVFLHSFLKPPVPHRIRWNNASEQGISRKDILQSAKELPTQQDLLALDFFKGKQVVCLNPNLDPCKSFVNNAHAVYGIIAAWQDTFAGNEEVLKLIKPSQMLSYLGFADQDDSGARYSPLLCRLHSLVAIWLRLQEVKQKNVQLLIPDIFATFKESTIWPIQKIEELDILKPHNSFAEVSPSSINALFSENLADYLDWYNLSIFNHDWELNRKSVSSIDILKGKKDMAEFIFNRCLSYNMRLWVLIFYALYDKKVDYAREIALHNADFKSIHGYIKEDFSSFLIKHLDEFLTKDQKNALVRSMVKQAFKNKSLDSYQDIDFDAYRKTCQKERHLQMRFYERYPDGVPSVKAFREILSGSKVVYRCYEISGNETERQQCIYYINKLFRDFLLECSNPFASFFTDHDLSLWVGYITGYTIEELARTARPNDEEALQQMRAYYISIVDEEKLKYVCALKQRLTDIITKISKNIYADFSDKFNFMGTSIKVIVTKKQGSFIKRIFKI